MNITEIKLTLFLDDDGKEDWKIESSRPLPPDIIAKVFEGLAKQIREKNPKHYEELIRAD